jgi:hypothetical protein
MSTFTFEMQKNHGPGILHSVESRVELPHLADSADTHPVYRIKEYLISILVSLPQG